MGKVINDCSIYAKTQCAHIGSIPLIEFFILFFISLGVLHEIAVMDSFDEPKIWEKGTHMCTTKGHKEFSFSNPFYFKTERPQYCFICR